MEMIVTTEGTAAAQRRELDDLVARGVAGIAVSVDDAAHATEELNKVAAKAVLFTTDSDAPQSKRVAYIGTDNVAAGRQAGEEIMKALPNGGKIMLFVGTHGRRQRARARAGHPRGAEGQQGRDPRRAHRPGRLHQGQEQRRGHAGEIPRHRADVRAVELRHAGDLRRGEERRQVRQGEDRRLRRGRAHAARHLRGLRASPPSCSSRSSSATCR